MTNNTEPIDVEVDKLRALFVAFEMASMVGDDLEPIIEASVERVILWLNQQRTNLLQEIREKVIGKPEKGMESKVTKTPLGLQIDEWGDIASGFRNELRAEQRAILDSMEEK